MLAPSPTLPNSSTSFAPPALAESWDNVGLLVGRHEQPVARVMTCLTITPASAARPSTGGPI